MPPPVLSLINCQDGTGEYQVFGGCPPYVLKNKPSHSCSDIDWQIYQDDIQMGDIISLPCNTGGTTICGHNSEYKIIDDLGQESNIVSVGVAKSSEDFEYSPDNPSTIQQNGSVTIEFTGGVYPFTVTVYGTGFWLDDSYTLTEIEIEEPNSRSFTLHADGSSCGTATVRVKDDCGACNFDYYVRGNVGDWEEITPASCLIPGPMTNKLAFWEYERIQGKYKQYQHYSRNSRYLGTCLRNEPPCGNQGDYCCYPISDPGEECITVESTDIGDGYDRFEFPCIWMSPEAYTASTGDPDHSYCINKGWMGWTNMECLYSSELRLSEWKCN
jgi:hypothetical protein